MSRFLKSAGRWLVGEILKGTVRKIIAAIVALIVLIWMSEILRMLLLVAVVALAVVVGLRLLGLWRTQRSGEDREDREKRDGDKGFEEKDERSCPPPLPAHAAAETSADPGVSSETGGTGSRAPEAEAEKQSEPPRARPFKSPLDRLNARLESLESRLRRFDE